MTGIPSLGPRGEGWVAAQLVLLISAAALGAFALPAGVASAASRWPVMLTGLILMAVGVFSAARGLRDLGPNLTALPRPRPDAHLVETGIFAHIRHPIYAGLMAITLGWGLVAGSGSAFILGLTLVLVLDLKARREEAWLSERFAGYDAYRARTHRFIPGVY